MLKILKATIATCCKLKKIYVKNCENFHILTGVAFAPFAIQSK